MGEKIILITSSPGDYNVLKDNVVSLGNILSCSISDRGLKITHTGKVQLHEIFDIFGSHEEKIITVESSTTSLEDVFIHASGEEWH